MGITKHIIYPTELEAQQRCNQAFDDIHCTGGGTTAYAVPIKHTTQDLWAVPIDENYKHLFTEQGISEAVELTPDWFPKIEKPF